MSPAHLPEDVDRELLLRSVPLFAGVPDDAIAALAQEARVGMYPKGDEIIREGAEFDDESDGLTLLISGQVEVRKGSSDGVDGHLIARLGPGEFFGEMALLDGGPRSASVFAATECQCLVLHRWDFLRHLRRYPDIGERMLATLSRRLRPLNDAVGRPE